MVLPQLATKNHTVTHSSRCDGEENQKEKAKLLDWDKNSLTEWQREKKITVLIKEYTACNVLTARCSACS